MAQTTTLKLGMNMEDEFPFGALMKMKMEDELPQRKMKMEDEFPFGAFFRLSFRDELLVFGGGGLPHSLLVTCSAWCV